ncbi:MAG TPA: MFS transporter [Streptosporangiaceae bacterium]|nr:MFS transporter [Streptosporangiaceae bacterium]
MTAAKWWRIGGTLILGLFVAYLDRSNLSVGISGISHDFGFTGKSFASTSSWALTAFLFGYLAANLAGGFLTIRLDPKWTLVTMIGLFSLSQLLTGWTDSVGLLIFFRVVLGLAEGIYWPQQFRLAKAWFNEQEMTRGSAMVQYYGQYLALALGFFLLTPLYDHVGWRPLFWLTGGVGLAAIVPLYIVALRSRPPEAARFPSSRPAGDRLRAAGSSQPRPRLTASSFGGVPFLLLVFSYFTNGMLFWGVTLWIPLAVKALGFTGGAQGLASALPYVLSLLLAVPVSMLSDRTGKRLPIAASGLFVAGVLLMLLPFVASPAGKLALICVAIGYYTAAYTTNLWAVAISDFDEVTVGPATGIINGFGAGGGGIVAGFVVGHLRASTGSYVPGFVVLGVCALLGAGATLLYGRYRRSARGFLPISAPFGTESLERRGTGV